MAIEYAGWIEVPRGKGNIGEIVRIPFTFQTVDILTHQERIDYMKELYKMWLSLIIESDPNRQGAYGDIQKHKFTSVLDLGFGTDLANPHFGR